MAVLVSPLPVIVFAFSLFTRDAYFKPTSTASLQTARAQDDRDDHGALPKVVFDLATYTQPALRRRPPLHRGARVADEDLPSELAAVLGDDVAADDDVARAAALHDARPSRNSHASIVQIRDEVAVEPRRQRALLDLLNQVHRGDFDFIPSAAAQQDDAAADRPPPSAGRSRPPPLVGDLELGRSPARS